MITREMCTKIQISWPRGRSSCPMAWSYNGKCFISLRMQEDGRGRGVKVCLMMMTCFNILLIYIIKAHKYASNYCSLSNVFLKTEETICLVGKTDDKPGANRLAVELLLLVLNNSSGLSRHWFEDQNY